MTENPQHVPFVDLDRIHEPLRPQIAEAIERVLRDGDFVGGSAVGQFEVHFAEYIGTRHCVSTATGTAALTLAMVASGIEPGAEVLVPATTFAASALAVIHAGMAPVFCDVDRATGLLDFDDAATRVTPRTQAVMPVHLYGQACESGAIRTFADKHGLAVIEDAAQAHGAMRDGVKAGAMGTVSAFSFYPSKNLGALGDGGAICTDDSGLARRVSELRDLGQRSKGEFVRLGYNERLDTLQAAVLGVKLPHLDRWNSERIAAARMYDEMLPDGVTALPPAEGPSCVYHVYPVRVSGRDSIRGTLEARGIGIGVHYSEPLHRLPPFAEFASTDLPEAESWAGEELSLPMFAGISEAQVDRVCTALAEALRPG